jgi:hypothetical protein
MGDPLIFMSVCAPWRRFGALVEAITTGRRFQKLCVEAAKWFRHGKEMFHRCVVRPAKLAIPSKSKPARP